jgi:hypothetical protein
MTTLFQRLFDKWKTDGVAIRPPREPRMIVAFEERYHVRLSADFREYLAWCDGMDAHETDEDFFSFWSLSRIRPIPEELPEPCYWQYREFPGASRFFCFMDWSIHADVFALELHNDLTSANRVFALGPRPLAVVGFSGFVEAYLRDWRALLE